MRISFHSNLIDNYSDRREKKYESIISIRRLWDF